MKTPKLIKHAAVAAVILCSFAGRVFADPHFESPYTMGVRTISYSSNSKNFYFWLDDPPPETDCEIRDKFGISVDPKNDELIAQVKMAFFSGKQVKVSWTTREGVRW